MTTDHSIWQVTDCWTQSDRREHRTCLFVEALSHGHRDMARWLDGRLIQHPALLCLPFINCMQLLTLKHARLLAVWFIAELKASGGEDKLYLDKTDGRTGTKTGSVIPVRTQESKTGSLLKMVIQKPRTLSIYRENLWLFPRHKEKTTQPNLKFAYLKMLLPNGQIERESGKYFVSVNTLRNNNESKH